MTQQTITIAREEYDRLKRQAEIDTELLQQFMQSFKEIRLGKIRRVK